jgi:hypothetical protein
MLRAAALSLLMLFTVVTMLPLTNSSAHNNGASAASSHKKRFRRHSRAWWRRYRARQRRRRAALAQQKALEAMRTNNPDAVAGMDEATTGGIYNHPRGLWNVQMPDGWSNRPATDGNEMKFRINAGGRTAGQATLSVVAMANGSQAAVMPQRKQSQSLSGVPVSALRRTVIDKMIKEGGWVVNDYQKEINGRRVFVVQAQTPASADGRNPAQSETYYFTEVDGRIYSLATTAPVDAADRVAAGSEQVMSSFSTSTRSAEAATSPR